MQPSLEQARDAQSFAMYFSWLLAAAEHQQNRGLQQWTPSAIRAQHNALQRAFEQGHLYLLNPADGGALISNVPKPIWKDTPGEALYVDKMVTAPTTSKRGERLLLAISEHAASRNVRELRLDCVANNSFLVHFYTGFGFYPVGEVEHAGERLLRLRLRIDHAQTLQQHLKGWQPDLVGTLLFALRSQQVLLIRKLRGHGVGKTNAPGGKLEPGETAADCARRETFEEVGLTVHTLQRAARLRFLSVDEDQWLGHVFTSTDFGGLPTPSEEAEPFWCPRNKLPFERMWADDRVWLPRVLSGEHLAGDFLFRNGELLAHRLYPLDVV